MDGGVGLLTAAPQLTAITVGNTFLHLMVGTEVLNYKPSIFPFVLSSRKFPPWIGFSTQAESCPHLAALVLLTLGELPKWAPRFWGQAREGVESQEFINFIDHSHCSYHLWLS